MTHPMKRSLSFSPRQAAAIRRVDNALRRVDKKSSCTSSSESAGEDDPEVNNKKMKDKEVRNNKATGNEVKDTQVKDKEVKAGSEVKDNQVKDKEKEADNKMKDNGASASQSSASSQATLYLVADTQVVVEDSQAEDGHVY